MKITKDWSAVKDNPRDYVVSHLRGVGGFVSLVDGRLVLIHAQWTINKYWKHEYDIKL